MEEPIHGVFISSKEIYDEVRGTREDVQKLLNTVSDVREDIRDHEDRLKIVERKVWAASGVAAFLAGGGVSLIQLFTKGG